MPISSSFFFFLLGMWPLIFILFFFLFSFLDFFFSFFDFLACGCDSFVLFCLTGHDFYFIFNKLGDCFFFFGLFITFFVLISHNFLTRV